MNGGREPEDMSGAELLDHADVLARTQRRCEAEILLVARQHAVINNADTVDPMQAKIPGGERARMFGGDGTPLVAEFSPATLAARLGLSTHAGRELMADALDLAHRLPQLWERVQALEVKGLLRPVRGSQDPRPHSRASRVRRRAGRGVG
jgi:hypothetical protein